MATVDKNFKVKNGLVVEGTTATVNGNDILTTANAASANTPNTIVERDSSGNFEAGTINANWVNVGTIVGTRGPSGDDLGLYSGTDMSGIELSATGGIHIFTNGGEKLLLNGLTAADEVATVGYVDTAVNGIVLDTDHVTEANNLYFTTERAQDAVGLNLDNGLVYDDASGKIGVKLGAYDGGVLEFDSTGHLKVRSDANPQETGTLTVQGSYNQLKVNTNVIATRTYADDAAANALTSAEAYADGLINDGAIANTSTWSSNKIDYQISTAVANLVDGAPELLNTLNELAAAIADNPNYATDVANLVGTKQDSFTAGDGLQFVANNQTLTVNTDQMTITASGGQLAVVTGAGLTENTTGVFVDVDLYGGIGFNTADQLKVNTDYSTIWNTPTGEIGVHYGDGLTVNTTGLIVDTNTIASVDYVNTNFVGFDDLPGQLGDYVPLTQKGANDGVATLDSTGQVPLNQLGNVPDAYITSVGTNLSVTGGQLDISSGPSFVEVDVNAVAKQVASTTTVAGGATSVVYSFSYESYGYRSAEYLVKSYGAGESLLTKILLTLDDSNNIAITEYGSIDTNGYITTVTAEINSVAKTVELKVTNQMLAQSATVNVYGTLLR